MRRLLKKCRPRYSRGGGPPPRAPGSPRGTFWLWLGCRVQFVPKSCPRPGETYIHATCPTRVVSKNDSGLGKPRFTENAKTTHKRCEAKACQNPRPGWGKTRVHDKTPRETFVPNRNVRHDVRQKHVCGSHLAPMLGKPRLASNDFEQASV